MGTVEEGGMRMVEERGMRMVEEGNVIMVEEGNVIMVEEGGVRMVKGALARWRGCEGDRKLKAMQSIKIVNPNKSEKQKH